MANLCDRRTQTPRESSEPNAEKRNSFTGRSGSRMDAAQRLERGEPRTEAGAAVELRWHDLLCWLNQCAPNMPRTWMESSRTSIIRASAPKKRPNGMKKSRTSNRKRQPAYVKCNCIPRRSRKLLRKDLAGGELWEETITHEPDCLLLLSQNDKLTP